jgi:hypothetical protein
MMKEGHLTSGCLAKKRNGSLDYSQEDGIPKAFTQTDAIENAMKVVVGMLHQATRSGSSRMVTL